MHGCMRTCTHRRRPKSWKSFLLFGVLYHAANGMRIIIIDFFPALGRFQRTIVRIELVLVALVLVPAAILTLSSLF